MAARAIRDDDADYSFLDKQCSSAAAECSSSVWLSAIQSALGRRIARWLRRHSTPHPQAQDAASLSYEPGAQGRLEQVAGSIRRRHCTGGRRC